MKGMFDRKKEEKYCQQTFKTKHSKWTYVKINIMNYGM